MPGTALWELPCGSCTRIRNLLKGHSMARTHRSPLRPQWRRVSTKSFPSRSHRSQSSIALCRNDDISDSSTAGPKAEVAQLHRFSERHNRCNTVIMSRCCRATTGGMTQVPTVINRRSKMRKFMGTLLAMAVAAATQATVKADHNYGPDGNNAGSAYSSAQSYHSRLTHRSNDRQSYHDQAHNLGLDNRQHNSLHQSMSHGAFHDNQDHANFDNNSGRRFNGSGYGNPSVGGNYSSQQQYSASPYTVNPSYGNQFSTGPYSTQPYSGSHYSTASGFGSSYSTRAYGMPRNLNHGNGSYSTIPRW